ncbi:molybdopterin-dependent oxidoreductase [Caulobacter sp. FWC2]|uniref:molybdopterin-dependent oxidoreductase n=1 Tax=Caulobacter sp. FWC2 TaxID=69664 RepID=UPI000C151AD5|nr:molybdopterin-dependent oxidoreductase [Caulobacter sp. FWC2]PIB93616.1 molybdopterin-dependent oxidoreductase [Caulobacter sp. FWC2]
MRLLLALALTALLATSAAAQDLKVTVAGRDTVTLSPKDLAALPRAKATITVKGAAVTYEGVRLDAVLAQAGVVHGERLMGRYLNQVIIARAADGFFSVLSLAETDPVYRANPVVVADTVGGHKLDDREGPYRLVVDGDLRASRAPRQLVSIEVKPAF